MKSSKLFLIFTSAIFSLFFFAIFVMSIALFRSAERGENHAGGSAKISQQILNIQEQMHYVKSAEDIRRILKAAEKLMGSGDENEPAEKLKKIYAPLLAHYANKPREAETHHLLIKKKDILEISLNNYRKEIPHGDIRVRALLLNVIFDTQNSLLNESKEMEDVYLKHIHERISSLQMLAAQDQALLARINVLDGAIASYEKAYQMNQSWDAEYTEILTKAEKGTTSVLQELKYSVDGGTESSRRNFLYTGYISIAVCLLSLGLIFLGRALIENRFTLRANLINRYLSQFGQEKTDLLSKTELNLLHKDGDWGKLLSSVEESETKFAQNFQTQLCVSKSIRLPTIVLSKDQALLYWNKKSAELFQIPEQKEGMVLSDIITPEKISIPQGISAGIVEEIKNSFSTPKEDIFEFSLIRGEEHIPLELISSPITSGPLAGGKLYLFREIREEHTRIERAVDQQLSYAQDLVHKMTHGYPFTKDDSKAYSKAVLTMFADLDQMKMKLEERETLWKSESMGLLDQVLKQQEILSRLSLEIQDMRKRHEEISVVVRSIYDAEGDIANEIGVFERGLVSWIENRKRLQSDLELHSIVLHKAKSYETSLRESVANIKTMLSAIHNDLQDLQHFREEARLQAINLSLSEEASPAELSAKARAYANQLGAFCDRLQKITENLNNLIQAHPGGALLPHLESADIDPTVLSYLQDEQLKLSASIERWKQSGAEILSSGERALSLLGSVDKIGVSAIQLGETSAIINEQTRANLSRWQ